jgi:hypothetical protein
VRFREDTPQEQARARAAVHAWRDEHPEGTPEQLVVALGRDFHRDYGVALRGLLFAYDRHRAHQITGVISLAAEAGR